jgi:hypothetical protein
MFSTCHYDVILGLGRLGATCKFWKISWRNSFGSREILSVKQSICSLEILSVSGILFEYHVESWNGGKWKSDFRAKKFT